MNRRRPAPKFYAIRNDAGLYLTMNGDWKPTMAMMGVDYWTRFKDTANHFSDNTSTTILSYFAQKGVKLTREVVA